MLAFIQWSLYFFFTFYVLFELQIYGIDCESEINTGKQNTTRSVHLFLLPVLKAVLDMFLMLTTLWDKSDEFCIADCIFVN